MKVKEPEMNDASGCATCTYLTYVETSLAESEKRHFPPPTPAAERTLPLHSSVRGSLPHRFKRLSLHRRLSSDVSSPVAGIRVDFLAHLPPELAVYILSLLHPRYLCRVVQVSRKWWWLAQFGSLRTRRLRYVQCKRDKYQQSKENVVPGQRHPNRTPRTLTRNSLIAGGSSPLASIQSSRHRHTHTRLNSPHSGTTNRDGETPIRLSRHQHSVCWSERQRMGTPVLETPESNNHSVHRLAEDDPSYVVRRCLFPNSPALSRPKHKHHSTVTDDNTAELDSELVCIKTNASKRRLKRL